MRLVGKGQQFAVAPAVTVCLDAAMRPVGDACREARHLLRAVAVGRGEAARQYAFRRDFRLRAHDFGDAEMAGEGAHPVVGTGADNQHFRSPAQAVGNAGAGVGTYHAGTPDGEEAGADFVEAPQRHACKKPAEEPLLGLPVRVEAALVCREPGQVAQQAAQQLHVAEGKAEERQEGVALGDGAVEVEDGYLSCFHAHAVFTDRE